ncbi:9078_t:CDS:2, partial [Acaulospora colombiana]
PHREVMESFVSGPDSLSWFVPNPTLDSIAGYFSDLGDGVHKGDAHDPRVSIIKVVPNEIRYWVATSGAVGRALEHAKGAVTGKLTAPGEIRTITADELKLVYGLNQQQS